MRYQDVKARLLSDLQGRSPSDKLPSRPMLCRQYGVSRVTLDKAVHELTAEGLLQSRKGSGTYYASKPGMLTPASETLIGVLIPNMLNTIYVDVLRGMKNVLSAAGATPLVIETDNDIDRLEAGLRHCVRMRVRGMLILPTQCDDMVKNGRIYGYLQKTHLPYVLFNRSVSGLQAPVVNSDNYYGAFMAVRHLYEKGYREIAFMAGRYYQTSVERCSGYVSAMKALGLPLSYKRIILRTAGDNSLRGYSDFKHLLKLEPALDAVVCSHDSLALGAYMAISECGKRVSEDIGVIGYDNTEYCRFSSPPLTSIAYRGEEVGTNAAALLLDMLRGTPLGDYCMYSMTPEIIERSSCLGPGQKEAKG